MKILGLSGGASRIHEESGGPIDMAHDASAVLLDDGRVVVAIEQERLDRLKHSNKVPLLAVRECLRVAGIGIDDVDRLAFPADEGYQDRILRDMYMDNPGLPFAATGRDMLRMLAMVEFGADLPPEKICFVPHHYCHAVSAYALSGFDRALVVTLDGRGEDDCGMVLKAAGAGLETLRHYPVAMSVGHFYEAVTRYLGFGPFDEYKVMGLAPYGDPARFRELFRSTYKLLPEGEWSIASGRLVDLIALEPPRRRWEEISQGHMDIAAALQESLEEILFHILRHHRTSTGERSLCYAGGVAHNGTFNGKLLRSGLFDDVFVQPAAHDAGLSLGAALAVHLRDAPNARPTRLRHVYWGTDVAHDEVPAALAPWQQFIAFERAGDVARAAARLVADGRAIGWVQGRAEFGPRALGNRSILADPRPAANKELINAMVKKREGFRPFAPAVLEEDASAWFDVPAGLPLPFMAFVVPVREAKRAMLGAVTHVDGTARVQTVARDVNERFWSLIHAFGELTGVPVLLNTSFNNNAEPIVDSVEDAVVSFLTTELHALVVDDYVVTKRDFAPGQLLDLCPALPPQVRLVKARGPDADGRVGTTYRTGDSYHGRYSTELSEPAFEVLSRADGRTTGRELAASAGVGAGPEAIGALAEELAELWARRIVRLHPRVEDAREQ